MEATPAKNQRLGPILYYIPSQNALFCLPITARRNGGHAHAHACASLDLLRVLLVESWINLWKMMTTAQWVPEAVDEKFQISGQENISLRYVLQALALGL